MIRYLSLIVVLVAVIASLLPAQVTPIPVTPDDPEEENVAQVQILMQAKLSSAQAILAGLVTQDFEAIEKAASGLTRISLTTPIGIRNSPDEADRQVYEHFRLEFMRLAGQLERHAASQELEASAYVQQNLTATCIACHDHMSSER